jgi:hypothetical protein
MEQSPALQIIYKYPQAIFVYLKNYEGYIDE